MTFQFNNVNHEGYVFADFFPMRDHTGPGWFVFGRNPLKYGCRDDDGSGRYIKLCAFPDKPERRHVHYNGPVRHGWRTKRDAQQVADWLNRANIDPKEMVA